MISEYNGNYTFVIWNSELLSIDCGTLLCSPAFYTLFSGCAFRKQIGWLTYAQSFIILSVASSYWTKQPLFYFFCSLFTYTVNAIIICHQITCYYNTEDAVMKMQYILLYNLFFMLTVWFSPLTRCYIVLTHLIFLMPWVDYRLFKLPLTYYYLFTECQSHMQNSLNAALVYPSLQTSEDPGVPLYAWWINHKQPVP